MTKDEKTYIVIATKSSILTATDEEQAKKKFIESSDVDLSRFEITVDIM